MQDVDFTEKYSHLTAFIDSEGKNVSWPGGDVEETSEDGPANSEANDDQKEEEGCSKVGEHHAIQRSISLNMRHSEEQDAEKKEERRCQWNSLDEQPWR